MQDNGSRRTFDTGSVRDTIANKPAMELVSPFSLERLGHWFRKGAEKYAPRNWEKGQPFGTVTGSMFRHLLKWMAGDDSEDHLAAIAWNAMAIMHYQEMIKRGALPESLNDMPDYKPVVEIDERAFDFKVCGSEAAPPAVPSGDSPRRGEALVR